MLGVGDGDVVLEIGAGTGEDTQRFARAATAGGGFAVGVEIATEMAVEAAARARGVDGVSFVVADGRRLPFRGEVFTAAYAERVLQHVPGPAVVVGELHRVLAPSGRVLLFEPDQDLRALDHPDRATEAIVRARSSARFENPSIGRQLHGLLVRAGFEVRSVEGTASGVVVSEASGARALLEECVATGDVESGVAAAYVAELDLRIAEGSAFSVWIAFDVLAIKRQWSGANGSRSE